ncbi:MAG: M17 family peptidase N-terminal domain-containing protein, partial [Candidatus Micrarchaeia archaeon]
MEFSVLKQPSKAGAASVHLLFEGEKAESVQFSKEDFSAKPGETCIIRKEGVSILVGLGKKADFEDEKIRQAAGAFVYAS